MFSGLIPNSYGLRKNTPAEALDYHVYPLRMVATAQMTLSEEEDKRTAVETVLSRLADGGVYTRDLLFSGTPKKARGNHSWQKSMLRRMTETGLTRRTLEKIGDTPTYQAMEGRNLRAYIGSPRKLITLMKPFGRLVDEFLPETSEPEDFASTRAGAEQRLREASKRASQQFEVETPSPFQLVPKPGATEARRLLVVPTPTMVNQPTQETTPKSNEPPVLIMAVPDIVPSASGDEPTEKELLAQLFTLCIATSKNMIYFREQADKQLKMLKSLEQRMAALEKAWT